VIARAVVLLPLALTAALIPTLPYGGVITRVLVLVSVVPGVLYAAQGWRRTEAWWVGVTFLYLLATFFSTLFATDFREASLDLVRQAYIVSVSLLLMLSLRNPISRAALARGMVLLAIACALMIFVLYVSYAGFSFGSLADLREFKFYTQESLDVPLNPISFAMILAFLLAYPALSQRRWIAALTTVVVLAATVLSFSRTTLLVLLLGSSVVGLVAAIRRQPVWLRQTVYPFAAAGLVVAGVYLLPHANGIFDSYELSELTSGRSDIWPAAWDKFVDAPLTGWGADPAFLSDVNLVAYLPVYDPWLLESLRSAVEAGSFHNIYLTVLAEKGLIVFIPSMVMAAFLIRQSWRLHAHRVRFSKRDAAYATVAPLIVVIILVRGLSEHAGWWADANATVDYLSYVAASLIIATVARLDQKAYPKLEEKGGKQTQ
jgi:O-antigen ligase